MSTPMKVIKVTSSNEKNSLQEAINTKTSSQFIFEGIDKNTNGKRIYMFTTLYDDKEKVYQMMGDRYFKSSDKVEFIDMLNTLITKMGFKDKSTNEAFATEILSEGTIISSTDENFDSLEEKSFDKQLRSSEADYSNFLETVKTLSNEDLDLLGKEIVEIYEKNKIPKYETRKRQIENTIKDQKGRRLAVDMANKIVTGELEIPKLGNPILDRLIEKVNNEWRQGVGQTSNFDNTHTYTRALEFFQNKEVVALLEPLIEKVKGTLSGEKTFLTSAEKDSLIMDIISNLSIQDAVKFKGQFDELIIDIKNDILGGSRKEVSESYKYVLHYGDYGYTSTNNRIMVKDRANALNEWKGIIDEVTGYATFATLNKHTLTGGGVDTFGKTEELFITKNAFIKMLDDSYSLTREIQYAIKGDYTDTKEVEFKLDRESYSLGITFDTLKTYVMTEGVKMSDYYSYIVKLVNGTFSKNGIKITII